MQNKNKICLVVICQAINTITMNPYVVIMYFLLKWGSGPQSEHMHLRLEYYVVVDCINFLFCMKNE